MVSLSTIHRSLDTKPAGEENSIERCRDLYQSLSEEIVSFRHILQDLLSRQNTYPKDVCADKILIKSNKHLVIINNNDVDWIEAWGDYIRVHCREKKLLVREKIHEIENRLNPKIFIRISRSALINIDHIKELEPINHGDYLITMDDGTQLNLSRNYRNYFYGALDHHFKL